VGGLCLHHEARSVARASLLAQPVSHGPSQFRSAGRITQVARISNTQAVLRHRESKTTGAGAAAAVTRMAAPTDEAAGSGTPGTTDPFLADWRERIIIPAVAAGEPSPIPMPRLRFSGQVLPWAGVPDPLGFVDLVAVQVWLEPRLGCCRGTGRALAPPAPPSPTPRTSPSSPGVTEVRSPFHGHTMGCKVWL
jgi:hypothetical protein